MAHPNDQHVIPVGDGEHDASSDCPCLPRVDEGVPHPSGARVWIHTTHEWRATRGDEAHEEKLVCDRCGLYASESAQACEEPEPDGCVSPAALSGALDGGGPA